MSKYLDSNGLLYVWQKIKGAFVAKENGKGLSSNDYTTTEKNKLAGIEAGANAYSLPTAGAETLGGVKVGANLSIDSNGVLSAVQGQYDLPTASAATKGGVKIGANLTMNGEVLNATDTTYSAATASADGLMSSSDKSKLDAFGAASTYALKTDVTGMYKYKGSVATTAQLPTSGQSIGDVYNVEATGMNYAWDGTNWDALGEIFQVDAITNAEIDTIVAS